MYPRIPSEIVTDPLVTAERTWESLVYISLPVCKLCCDFLPVEEIYHEILWGCCSQLYILLQMICNTYAPSLWALWGWRAPRANAEVSQYLPNFAIIRF